MSNEQLKTILMDRIRVNLSTDFRVVIMNRKPQIYESLVTWYKFTFAVCHKRDA